MMDCARSSLVRKKGVLAGGQNTIKMWACKLRCGPPFATNFATIHNYNNGSLAKPENQQTIKTHINSTILPRVQCF